MVLVGVESENLWRPAKIPATQLDRSPIPGTDIVIPLMAGDVSVVMKAFAAAIHEHVESLYNARGGTDEGGWTPSNSVATSNHLNGTAMDLNWSDHPMGKEYDGWSAEEIATIRELMEFFEGLIYWGNDWNSPKDSMHFQMNYGTYANRDKLADFIRRKIGPDGKSTFRAGTQNPSVPRKPVVPGSGGSTWADVSAYQKTPISDDYPHKVFSFRTNSGDFTDTLAVENAKRALAMLESGKLELVIPYYFFRPGQANCDLHKEILTQAGLFNHPRTVTMVDVEGDNGSVKGDNSWEINDEINRIRGWYGNASRVIGYYNSNADPALWPTRGGINLVVPQYGRPIGDIASIKDAAVRQAAIAHQYTSSGSVAQWSPVDINWSPYDVTELLQLFGIEKRQEGLFMYLTQEEEFAIRDKILGYKSMGNKWPSRALFADDEEGVDDTVGMLLNGDGNIWDVKVVLMALCGSEKDLARVRRLANGGGPNGNNAEAVQIAQGLLRFLEGTSGSREHRRS